MITHTRPHTGLREAIAAGRVVMSRWLGVGPQVAAFEAEFARFAQVDRANLLTLFCASDALCLSMELLGIGPGDQVVIPSIHFVGAANAVLRRRAMPVYCDVNRFSLNATETSIKAKLTDRTKAILLLHYGQPCDMEAILSLGLPVVEDCSVGLGIKPTGVMAMWSFDPMKLIATPDGGGLWCRDARMAERARLLASHGMSQLHGYASKADTRWWEFEVKEAGRLSEFNDVAAAIGLAQLRRLSHDLARRRAIAGEYRHELHEMVSFVGEPSYNLCPIQTKKRDGLARHLRENGIYTTFRYHPLHLAYRTGVHLVGAEWAADHTLLLPLHAGLRGRDVRKVIQAVKGFYHAD